ncbi:MAG: ADP-ribose pyrophosphatase [Myxococcota bacterium]|jgi:ADP-ribose pyrophosphatase
MKPPARMSPWKLISQRVLGDFRIFSLHEQRLQHPTSGDELPFFVMETVDWCNIIALTPEREVVLVRQHRAGTSSVTLEIPGGMVDPGEDPQAAAVRELAEETGYVAGKVVSLGSVHPNPAIQTNRCFSYLALDCQRLREQSLDGGEHIEVLTRPLSDMDSLMDDGEITHALVVAAFGHFGRHLARTRS